MTDIRINRPGLASHDDQRIQCARVAYLWDRMHQPEKRCPCCGQLTQERRAMGLSLGQSILFDLMMAGF